MELRSKIIEVKIYLKTFKEKIRDSRIKAERIDLKKYIYIYIFKNLDYFSFETVETRRHWNKAFTVLQEKKNPVDQDVYIPKKNIL